MLAALGSQESAAGAASALRHMCEACSGLLGPVADELLATYAKTQGLGPLEKGAVRNGQLQLQERYVLQVRPLPAPPARPSRCWLPAERCRPCGQGRLARRAAPAAGAACSHVHSLGPGTTGRRAAGSPCPSMLRGTADLLRPLPR